MHLDFTCPECGGRTVRVEERVSPINREGDPWSRIFHRLECYHCGACIPAHLGLRFNGLSQEIAIAEWESKYRSWPQSLKSSQSK